MKFKDRIKTAANKISKPLLAAAVFHWLITFVTDRLFFEYSLFSFGTVKEAVLSMYGWAVKCVFLVLLMILYQTAGSLAKKWKENHIQVKERMKFAGIYFLFMMILLLAVYPGAWRMDEFGILRDAKTLMPTFWQGYLTSCFYIFSLMILPIPAGVVVIQCGVISGVAGYLCERAGSKLNLKHKMWLLLPFLAFPVLDSNVYPMRMSVYVFLELLLAAIFLFAIWEKRTLSKGEKWAVIILTAIVTVWRTEAIYYIVWIPLIYLFIFWKKEENKEKISMAVKVVVLTVLVMLPQTLGNKMVSGDQYEITSMVLPIAPLLCEAETQGETSLMETIDKVLDTELMIDGYQNGKSGISVFWSEPLLIRENYTSAEYKEFKSAYYKLIMKYPMVFLKERTDTFFNSNGILMNTTELYDTNEVANYVEFRESYKGNHAISTGLRKTVLSILECRDLQDYNEKTSLYTIVWSVLPQLLVLLTALVISMIKRQWQVFVVLAGLLGKVPLIFLTAPSLLFMYYYGIYLTGNVVLVYGIYFLYGKYKSRQS